MIDAAGKSNQAPASIAPMVVPPAPMLNENADGFAAGAGKPAEAPNRLPTGAVAADAAANWNGTEGVAAVEAPNNTGAPLNGANAAALTPLNLLDVTVIGLINGRSSVSSSASAVLYSFFIALASLAHCAAVCSTAPA
jgi:hypothetical protein